MVRRKWWAALLVACLLAPLPAATAEVLPGHYEMQGILGLKGKTWRVDIKLDVTDDGEIGGATFGYMDFACKAQLKASSFKGDQLILDERITMGEALCEPGRYLLTIDHDKLHKGASTSPFISISFDAGDEFWRGRIGEFKFKPSKEAGFLVDQGVDGWDGFLGKANWDSVLGYVTRFPQSARQTSLLKWASAHPDIERLRALAEATKLSDIRAGAAQQAARYALNSGSNGEMEHFLAAFPAAADYQTVADRLFTRIADSRDAKALLDFANRYPHSNRVADAVLKIVEAPPANLADLKPEAWSAFYRGHLSTLANPAVGKAAKALEGCPTCSRIEIIRHLTGLPEVSGRKRSIDELALIARDSSFLTLFRLAPVEIRWSGNGGDDSGQGREARAILRFVEGGSSIETVASTNCSRGRAEDVVEDRPIIAFLIIPIGTEKMKVERQHFDCRLPSSALSALSGIRSDLERAGVRVRLDSDIGGVSYFTSRDVGAISRMPNAIGEALLQEARAPNGCKALRESCRAQCVGKSDRNGGFLVSSDKQACDLLCANAFYECSR
ncbi:hypothetical protein WV31_09745 [Magnetospirillum sp. ME-1]|uniref:hypothetical protein n=1 Tax=Magnetospirillum sp. ME-1 TaxID=1639348 RepID=UPI000A17DE4D|nr:hypothetical protein [Magnetospirillum sp. ME-1]ARJ65918.1 hypothetical protein WV31_09745 [Magnetospirillum sp. ME-1]